MPGQSQGLVWYHYDEGLLPMSARQPWQVVGTATDTLQDQGLQIAATAESGIRWRPMSPGDGNNSEPRTIDRAVMQWAVQGVSQVPGWASGLSPIAAGMDDKRRPIGVSIGPSLNWIDPYTGDTLGQILPSFPWLRRNTFRLLKERSARYRLFVNGTEIGSIPFNHIPLRGASILSPPRFFWGHFDAAGSSTALWTFVETALNKDLPPQWKVDRLLAAAPKVLRDNENSRWRAIRRMIVGSVQGVLSSMEEVGTLLTAYRQSYELFQFSGAIRPDEEVPSWIIVGTPGEFSVERDRVRIAASTTLNAVRADMDPSVLPQVEFQAAATFTFKGGTAADPQDRLGPYLEVRNGHRAVRAEMLQPTPGSDAIVWAVTEGLDAGPVTFLSDRRWQVNGLVPHRVELQVLGRDFVLMLIDGSPVECIAYGDLTIATASFQVDIGRNGQAGGTGISTSVEIEDGIAQTRYVDLARRELFLQVIAERLVFTGGCERNDWLDTLMRHRFELSELRGTTVGIVLETQRLSCSRNSDLIVEGGPAAWYLDVTYPTCGTPIYLDSTSTLQTMYLEVHNRSPNFSPERLAELLRLYVVPVGVIELRFFITLATFLSGASVNAGTTTFAVDIPAGFSVGDTILLRDAGNTVQAAGTILNISQVTGAVETTLLDGSPFAAGATMRKILLET